MEEKKGFIIKKIEKCLKITTNKKLTGEQIVNGDLEKKLEKFGFKKPMVIEIYGGHYTFIVKYEKYEHNKSRKSNKLI